MPALSIEQMMEAALQRHHAGQLREAEALYRQVLAQNPQHGDALHLIGYIAHQVNRRQEAIALILQAIAINPRSPVYFHNLGVILCADRRYEHALAAWRKKLELEPGDVLARRYVAATLEVLGRISESIAEHREVVRLAPDSAEDWAKLGSILEQNGQPQEAQEVCEHALRLRADLGLAHHALANALKDQGRIREAIAAIRRALCFTPENVRTFSNLLYTSHFDPDVDPRALYHEHLLFNAVYARPLERQIQPHANDRSPDRRLRIGYVSPDFRAHSTTFFTWSLIAGHDRRQFEIFCYGDVMTPDSITEKIRKCTDVWRDISGQTDENVAAQITADRIDILIDLALHTSNGRPLLFARKPAPIQVTWLGYPGTTGLTVMDYRLTDPHLDPEGVNDSFYFEKSIRLPATMWCYQSLPDAPSVGPLPAVSAGHITFACLNNFSKVNDRVVEMWIGVLGAVPTSRMLLVAPEGNARARFLERLQKAGIAADRIEFIDRQPWADYMALYGRIDIVLDTYPWNGHTMSLDALWMGVPIVTLCGRTAVSRAGLCFLTNLDLTDLVAHSAAEYLQIAANLAKDLPRLTALRAELRSRMQRSPLTDQPHFTKNLESVFRDIWRTWCATTK